MILSTLVIAMLGADGGLPQFIYLQEDAARVAGVSVTVRGMVRTLPPLEGWSQIGLALDDGTPVYVETSESMARFLSLMVGHFVGMVGVLQPLPKGGYKLADETGPALTPRHFLDHLDGKEVLLEGRAMKSKSGAPTLRVDTHTVLLPKLTAWPDGTTFVIVKGTMRRVGKEWILESSDWKPSERKAPPPKR